MNLLTDPRNIEIEEFTYQLPDERVAKFPLEERDGSKLLVYTKGNISQSIYKDLPSHLPNNSLLVFNNSRVVEARLQFKKPSGGVIEIFALEPHEQYSDITTAMNQTGHILYKCLVGGASKWKHGMVLEKKIPNHHGELTLKAIISERRPDCFVIHLTWTDENLSFAGILHEAGKIPIPPYLHREAEELDNQRYQTIYAESAGSVAAPTAGLHFTPALLDELRQKDFQTAFTTLHVGAGTFIPVKSPTMQYHEMHAEFLEVDRELLEALLQSETIIAVGTTAMRTVESIYWMGVKIIQQPNISLKALEMDQWEVYDSLNQFIISKKDAILALKNWLVQAGRQQLIVKTRILIAPGYRFGICNGLITNFHQPKSTLLLLVAALVGDDWKKIYQYALEQDFRFLSYGDGSLLLGK